MAVRNRCGQARYPERCRSAADSCTAAAPGSAQRDDQQADNDDELLANLYIDAGAIGARNRADAQHIAVATVSRVGVLVSGNFRHIVNLRKIQAYNSVTLREGYPTLEIRTPREVIDHGQD